MCFTSQNQEFQGVARIPFEYLSFHDVLKNGKHRPLSPRNVERLRQIFALSGCDRFEERHFVDGLIEREELDKLNSSMLIKPHDTERRQLKDISVVSVHVECLHGLHRVRAAEQILDVDDRWWTVRLFTTGLSTPAIDKIVNQYSNEKEFSDGEIFWNIRQCSHASNAAAERQWWARLTESKRKDLRQLLRDSRFAKAFDTLLQFPGLWCSVQLGTLHRLLSLKCDEEMLHYLAHIRKIWDQILEGVSLHQIDLVDKVTVEHVQARAPRLSRSDRDLIQSAMNRQEIFLYAQERVTRDRILSNLCSVNGLIPSLFTFFENLKYLEPCCQVMQRIVDPKVRKSIREQLYEVYSHQDILAIEHGESVQRIHPRSTLEHDRDLAYWQLWLFSMRNFPELTGTMPRKELGKRKPATKHINPVIWHKFGQLAIKLGFKTTSAFELAKKDPEMDVTRQMVTQLVGHAQIHEEQLQEIAKILRSSRNTQTISSFSQKVQSATQGCSIERRVGRPFENAFYHDRKLLYLPTIDQVRKVGVNYDISSAFAATDMITHFFGLCELPSFDEDTQATCDVNVNTLELGTPNMEQTGSQGQDSDRILQNERQKWLRDITDMKFDLAQKDDMITSQKHDIEILETRLNVGRLNFRSSSTQTALESPAIRSLEPHSCRGSCQEAITMRETIAEISRRSEQQSEETAHLKAQLSIWQNEIQHRGKTIELDQLVQHLLLMVEFKLPWEIKPRYAMTISECLENVKHHKTSAVPNKYFLTLIASQHDGFDSIILPVSHPELAMPYLRRLEEKNDQSIHIWLMNTKTLNFKDPDYIVEAWSGNQDRILFVGDTRAWKALNRALTRSIVETSRGKKRTRPTGNEACNEQRLIQNPDQDEGQKEQRAIQSPEDDIL